MSFTDNRQGRYELPVVIKDSRGSMSYTDNRQGHYMSFTDSRDAMSFTDNRQGRYELQGQSGQAGTLYELHRQQGHYELHRQQAGTL